MCSVDPGGTARHGSEAARQLWRLAAGETQIDVSHDSALCVCVCVCVCAFVWWWCLTSESGGTRCRGLRRRSGSGTGDRKLRRGPAAARNWPGPGECARGRVAGAIMSCDGVNNTTRAKVCAFERTLNIRYVTHTYDARLFLPTNNLQKRYRSATPAPPELLRFGGASGICISSL